MITVQDGVVRLDDAGVAALLSGDGLDRATTRALGGAGIAPAVETLRGPVVTLEVLIAGAELQLHRAAVDAQRAVVLLSVRPGLHQLMVLPPSHVAAALVRMTRTGPRRAPAGERRTAPAEAAARLLSADGDERRHVLHEIGATLAWRLRVGWQGEQRDLVAVDGPDGSHVLDADAGALQPVSATTLYRVFATVLPPAALEPTPVEPAPR